MPNSLASSRTTAAVDTVQKQLADIEQLIASAAGFQKARGDSIKVMAVDFVDSGRDIEPIPTPGIADAVFRQSGTLVNALVVLIVTGVVMVGSNSASAGSSSGYWRT